MPRCCCVVWERAAPLVVRASTWLKTRHAARNSRKRQHWGWIAASIACREERVIRSEQGLSVAQLHAVTHNN